MGFNKRNRVVWRQSKEEEERAFRSASLTGGEKIQDVAHNEQA